MLVEESLGRLIHVHDSSCGLNVCYDMRCFNREEEILARRDVIIGGCWMFYNGASGVHVTAGFYRD